MANHRMISKSVIETDAFLDLPPTAQMLYIHIGLNADDDGFTDRLKTICRMTGASTSDTKALKDAGYIHVFPSGVAVDLYWNVNNSIRKDRKKPTAYQEEMQSLQVVDSGQYIVKPNDNKMTTECQPCDNQMTAQAKLSKDKLSKDKGKAAARAREQTPFPVVVNDKEDVVREAVRFFTDHINSALYADGIGKVKLLLSQYGLAEFKRAVTLMAKRGGRSLNYLEKILQDPHEDTGQLEEATIRAVLK